MVYHSLLFGAGYGREFTDSFLFGDTRNLDSEIQINSRLKNLLRSLNFDTVLDHDQHRDLYMHKQYRHLLLEKRS